MSTVLLSLLMGAVLGFAAHRAGLCTVKAAAEILGRGEAHFLWSFAKSAGWVMGLTALAGSFGLGIHFRHWPASGASVLGGMLFGVGAGLNGGCTFSTLSRAMEGHLGLWLTVAGWAGGMLALARLPLAHPEPAIVGMPDLPAAVAVLLWAALTLEGGRILARLWRRRGLRRALGASVYTLSAGAALVGLANAVIVMANGPWSFTATLLCGLGASKAPGCARPGLAWAILVAALAGMAFSAVQRHSFALRLPRPMAALRHLGGGLLMGAGAGLIPGGNDGLILFAIPSLSAHALPAYAGLIAGVLAVLAVMRALGRPIPPVICRGDLCRAR